MKTAVKNKIAAGELVCTAYLCLLGAALPLAVHDAYFDITRTKAAVFWVLSGLLLLAWLVCALIGSGKRRAVPRLDLFDVLFAVFAMTHIVSTLLFRSSSDPLLAPDNRFQGVLSFLLYLPVFLILRRGGRFSSYVRFALLLGASAAALLGILNIFGADPLGLRAVSPAIELPRFLSTVGNISFFGALCVLVLPVAAYHALCGKTLRDAAPYALCALVLFFGGMAARTEGFLLGALAFFASLPLLCRDAAVLRRIPLLWALAAAAALLFSLVMTRWALYRPSDLTRLLCSPALLLPVCLLAAALFLWLRRRDETHAAKLRKAYIILFWTLLAALAVFLLLANTLWREKLPGSLSSFAVFSPSWGSDRGAEWASFWRMFCASPLPQKLIGSGAGSLAAWDASHPLFSDAVTDSAHNEYLHYLLTGGVIGLLSYLALLCLALRKALRAPSRGRTALALGGFAYSVQAAVNIAQPFTTPLFFALLALLCSDRACEEESAQGDGPFWYVSLVVLALVLLIAAAV